MVNGVVVGDGGRDTARRATIAVTIEHRLDELDRELEKRGHRFVRYADDCNIYVRSRRAAERVLASTQRYIEGRLRLKVNEEKSAVGLGDKTQVPGLQLLLKSRRGRNPNRPPEFEANETQSEADDATQPGKVT